MNFLGEDEILAVNRYYYYYYLFIVTSKTI